VCLHLPLISWRSAVQDRPRQVTFVGVGRDDHATTGGARVMASKWTFRATRSAAGPPFRPAAPT